MKLPCYFFFPKNSSPRDSQFSHSFQISAEIYFTLCQRLIVGYELSHPFKPTTLSFSWAQSQTFLAARCGHMWLRAVQWDVEWKMCQISLHSISTFSLKSKLQPCRWRHYPKWLHNNERKESNSLDELMYHNNISKIGVISVKVR